MAEERTEQAEGAEQPVKERAERRPQRQKQASPSNERGDKAERPVSPGQTKRPGPRRRAGPSVPPPNEIDYKNVDLLQRFLTDRGKIKARRKTGANATQQRRIARAIKRARHLALLPFTSEHIRGE